MTLPPRRPSETWKPSIGSQTSPKSTFGAAPARRSPPVPTVPIPPEARAALDAVIRDMRDVPRAIIGDPAEVVHFLGRQARRLAGVRDLRVPVAPLPAPKPPSAALMVPAGAAAARAAAESTFSTPARKSPASAAAPRSRVVRNRHGHAVPVELRRAQLDLPL